MFLRCKRKLNICSINLLSGKDIVFSEISGVNRVCFLYKVVTENRYETKENDLKKGKPSETLSKLFPFCNCFVLLQFVTLGFACSNCSRKYIYFLTRNQLGTRYSRHNEKQGLNQLCQTKHLLTPVIYNMKDSSCSVNSDFTTWRALTPIWIPYVTSEIVC